MSHSLFLQTDPDTDLPITTSDNLHPETPNTLPTDPIHSLPHRPSSLHFLPPPLLLTPKHNPQLDLHPTKRPQSQPRSKKPNTTPANNRSAPQPSLSRLHCCSHLRTRSHRPFGTARTRNHKSDPAASHRHFGRSSRGLPRLRKTRRPGDAACLLRIL